MLPLPAHETHTWTSDEPLECVMVIPEALDVSTFVFRAPSGAAFRFRPGQFLTFELPLPGGTEHRTYSISSSPARSLSLSVTVKAQPGSIGSRWLLDNLRPGMRMTATGPAGLFVLPPRPDDKYLFISAGSGITPTMAMTSFLFDRGEDPDVSFVTCVHRPSHLIFRKRLEFIASRLPGLKLHLVVTEDDPYDVWTGYRGRFNQLMLGLMTPDYLDRKVFCCGPEAFMNSVREMLHGLGYDMANYHQESFHAPAETAAELPDIEDVFPEEKTRAELVFANSGVMVDCLETDTVLAVAKASGRNIPSGCTFGLCGTCKIKKLSGEVHMVHNGGISEEEIAEGFILACCSNPIGRVEVAI